MPPDTLYWDSFTWNRAILLQCWFRIPESADGNFPTLHYAPTKPYYPWCISEGMQIEGHPTSARVFAGFQPMLANCKSKCIHKEQWKAIQIKRPVIRSWHWREARKQTMYLLHSVQTDSGDHPASYLTGTEDDFLRGKVPGAWSWPLTSNEWWS
jgi:hypothetical protein